MALIQWDESLSVGVPSMDAQHLQLVEIINRLHEAMRTRGGKEALPKTLSEMQKYTALHFAAEERLLKIYGYPELDDQKGKHKRFIEKLEEFQTGAQSGVLSTPVEVMSFLSEWLVKHIQKSDKKYSQLLIDNKVP